MFTVCGGDQLQVWVRVPSGNICILTCTSRHIKVQAFIPILAYPYEISSSPLSGYQVVCQCLEYVRLLIEELGSCLVHHACSASLYSSCQNGYILIAKLKNYNVYIAGIQETKWFNLIWHLAGLVTGKQVNTSYNAQHSAWGTSTELVWNWSQRKITLIVVYFTLHNWFKSLYTEATDIVWGFLKWYWL